MMSLNVRVFQLHRDVDVVGQSGTGVVADGSVYPSGKVTMVWRDRPGKHQSIEVWDSVEALIDTHGHDGATRLVWVPAAAQPGSRTIAVVIWEDRHRDVDALPFTDTAEAIGWAKARARESDRHGELDETLTDAAKSEGYVYCGCYSSEGDCISVVERVVDDAHGTHWGLR